MLFSESLSIIMIAIISKMLIGLTQQTDKLVFVASRPQLSVIANQSAFLVWQSPGPMEPGNDYHQKSRRRHSSGCYSVHFPSIRGIATTTAPAGASRAQPPKAALGASECAHWSRNDSIFSNNNFPSLNTVYCPSRIWRSLAFRSFSIFAISASAARRWARPSV